MSKPSFETLEKIKIRYPRVNLEWLITGVGEPLSPLGASSATTISMTGNTGNQVGRMDGGNVSQTIGTQDDLRAALDACRARNKELESTVADMRMVIDVLKGQK